MSIPVSDEQVEAGARALDVAIGGSDNREIARAVLIAAEAVQAETPGHSCADDLRETPEPTEWEYAALDEHGEPLFRGGPFTNIGIRLTELAEEGWTIYRRPAPGPWEPVENTEEARDA